jgi:CheY-like chemotaxis protein
VNDDERVTDVSELEGAETDRFSSDFDVRISKPEEDAAEGIRVPPRTTNLPSNVLQPMWDALAIVTRVEAAVEKQNALIENALLEIGHIRGDVAKLSDRQIDTVSAMTALLIEDKGVPGTVPSDRTILVVEDNDLLRGALIRELQRSGAQRLLEAYSVRSALEHEERIDVALIDVRLPEGGNGISLAKEIRKRNPHCKIVITTGGDISMLSHAVQYFGGVLMGKPFKLEAIRRELVPQAAE